MSGDDVVALQARIRELEEQARAMERAAAEVVKAKEAAEAANQAKTEFLAMMSHELRTPLNAILGFSEILRTEALGPIGADEYRDFAGDIYASGAHLLALINDLLDLAKVESGMVELRDTQLDLASVLDDAARIVAKTREAEGVNLVSEPAANLPLFKGDRRKLNQILLNLLSNAVKFTPAGGQVAIRADRRGDGGITISVSDTGIGIADADLVRVMEPFVQIDSALNRAHQGTGLGLPLCKKLTELHGGAFEMESRIGEGTTVRLAMPSARSIVADASAA